MSFIRPSSWQIFLLSGHRAGLFLCSLTIACGVAAWTGRLWTPERWEYSEIASNILSGHGAFYQHLGTKTYLYGSWIYPRLLAIILWMTGGRESAAVVLNALFMATTSVTVAAIGDAMFGPRKGAIAGVVAALHPGGLVYVGKLHSQSLDILLIALSFLLMCRLAANPGARAAALAGVVAGLAAISRGTVVPFFGLYAIWFVVVRRSDPWRALRALALVAVFAGAALVMPLAEGFSRYGELVPLRSDTGINLWIGNHREASGTSFTLDATPVPVQMAPELARQVVGRDESWQNEFLTAEVIRFVRAEPSAATALFAKKLWYFWWRSPHVGLLYPNAWTAVYFVYYSAVAAAGLTFLAMLLRVEKAAVRQGAQLFLLLALAYSVTQALFYVEGRHRWQIEPLLLLFAAAAWTNAWQWMRTAGSGVRIDSQDSVQVG